LQHCYINNVTFYPINNILLHYPFLFSFVGSTFEKFMSEYYPLIKGSVNNNPSYSLKSTDFINTFHPFFSTIAKQFAGQSCFYKVDKNYFNVFNRDRLLNDFLFDYFYSIEKMLG
jgi:hypothetical protein